MHRESSGSGLSRYRVSSSNSLSSGTAGMARQRSSIGSSTRSSSSGGGVIAGIPLSVVTTTTSSSSSTPTPTSSSTTSGSNRSSSGGGGGHLYSPSSGSSSNAAARQPPAFDISRSKKQSNGVGHASLNGMKEGPSFDPSLPSTDTFSWEPSLMSNICSYLPQRATVRSATVNKKWRKSIFNSFDPAVAVQSEKIYNEYSDKLAEDTQGVGMGKFFFIFYNLGLLVILGTSFANYTATATSDTNTTLALGVSFFGCGIIILMAVFIFCAAGNKGCKNVFREMLSQIVLTVLISVVMVPISFMWEVYRVVGSPVIDLNRSDGSGVCSRSAVVDDDTYVVSLDPSQIASQQGVGVWTAGEVNQYSGVAVNTTAGCVVHLIPGLATVPASQKFVVAPVLWWQSKTNLGADETPLYRAHNEAYPDVPLIGDDAGVPSASPGGLIAGLVIMYLVCVGLMILAGVYYLRVARTRSMMQGKVDTLHQDFTDQKSKRDEWHRAMKHGEVFDDVKAEETQQRIASLRAGQNVAAAVAW